MFENYNKIILFDTETTGLDAEKCQIIELAALVVERINGKLQATKKYDKLIKLINPNDKLPEEIVNLTHITDEMLSEYGILESDAAKDFYEMLHSDNGKVLVIAHNTQFDLNFIHTLLKHNFNDAYEVISNCDYLDTLTVVKDRKEYPHKLESCIEHYNLEDKVKNSHRAIDDVLALFAVTNAMAMERDDLDEYINIFGYNPKYGLSGIPFNFITYQKQYYQNIGILKPEDILPKNIK